MDEATNDRKTSSVKVTIRCAVAHASIIMYLSKSYRNVQQHNKDALGIAHL
jgi:hypothetical protein